MIELFMLMALTQSAPDPLAPARQGKLQCYSPDPVRKTCSAIAGYTPLADGKWSNVATVLIDPDQEVVMESVTRVHLEGEAVCGAITRSDMMAGTLSVRGKRLTEEQARPLLERIAQAFDAAGVLEKSACTTYVPQGDALRAVYLLDGKPLEPFQKVIWIDPNDGYRVGK